MLNFGGLVTFFGRHHLNFRGLVTFFGRHHLNFRGLATFFGRHHLNFGGLATFPRINFPVTKERLLLFSNYLNFEFFEF